MRRLLFAAAFLGLGVAARAQTPIGQGPPVIDIALRMVRAGDGGSSIARSAVRGDESSVVYSGLGPCIVGAAGQDPAHENSISWHASGHMRSVDGGVATADVEWQRLEYRPSGVVAGPRVRMTLNLPLGERVAVDFVDVSGSSCRMDALVFEIGAASDHGARLAMSGEGRSMSVASAGGSSGGRGGVAGGRAAGGGGAGDARSLTPAEFAEFKAQASRTLGAAEAARAAPIVTRPMPPRQFDVDVWLVPGSAGESSLSQRMSRVIGGAGGRFDFPPVAEAGAGDRSSMVEISALVIPVGGDQLVMAITRRTTSEEAGSSASVGWIKAVPLPKAGDVPSFEIPSAAGAGQRYSLRVRIKTTAGVFSGPNGN